MPITLMPLPYAKDALVPYMSAETLDYHHDKHHRSYVDALNGLVAKTSEANVNLSLEEIIRSADGAMLDNAAQIWNHDFFWKSMAPGGGGPPTGDLAQRLGDAFGSYQNFASEFAAAAAGRFGSGWAWLILRRGKLAVTTTANADLPLKHGDKALLTLDVWEHAYYIDHRNLRPRYVQTFLDHLVNWKFVHENLASL
jgi:Fe-Mn family superoxide dismutase